MWHLLNMPGFETSKGQERKVRGHSASSPETAETQIHHQVEGLDAIRAPATKDCVLLQPQQLALA
jgi:hypothetical protein